MRYLLSKLATELFLGNIAVTKTPAKIVDEEDLVDLVELAPVWISGISSWWFGWGSAISWRDENVGMRVGMFFSVLALGALIGPPISGAIYNATGGFKAVGYYAGESWLSEAMTLVK